MDRTVLRRLGWSEELIDAFDASTMQPDVTDDVGEAMPFLDVQDMDVGSSAIDLSDSPVVASSVVPASRQR